MRFCMVTTFYPPYSYGGDATYVRALARGLVERGHQVEVIASTDAYALHSRVPDDAAVEEDDGIVVHRLRSRFARLAPLVTQQTSQPGLYAAQLGRILRRRFDVLHFHNISLVGGLGVLKMGEATLRLYSMHEHWLLCAAHILWKDRARRCDGPTCLTCQVRSGIPPQLWRYGAARDRALAMVDHIFSPSEYTAQLHREADVTRPIEVLPLFSAIPASPIAATDRRSERPLFLFVGRVTASKGIDALLRVAARLPGYDFQIIGDGDLRAELERRYAAASHIVFTGHVAQVDLASRYRQATAIVVPSAAPETFGLMIVEAAQFGTAAIVHAGSGGAEELVRNSGGGVVYRDDAELEQALRSLADDPERRAILGERARGAYEANHTPARHFDRYLSRIDRLMAARRAMAVA